MTNIKKSSLTIIIIRTTMDDQQLQLLLTTRKLDQRRMSMSSAATLNASKAASLQKWRKSMNSIRLQINNNLLLNNGDEAGKKHYIFG